jgi:hypothetical protein
LAREEVEAFSRHSIQFDIEINACEFLAEGGCVEERFSECQIFGQTKVGDALSAPSGNVL